MATYKEKILSQYEPDIAVKLLEFAETISRHNCDVFVFMSRKFCCLYDLLISLGVPPVQKPIVSDKILDLETDFFKGKVVTIVDDIIICGTTIWKAKDRLLNYYEAKRVETFVFCVNEKYWVKECIDPEYKAVVLSEDRSLTFCASIVNSLSIAPRPYAIEFPYFAETEIKTQYWNQILSSKDWNVYDITHKLQDDNDVSTLTFFPSITIQDELTQTFGKGLVELIDIAKVRVYTRKTNCGIKMSILPIITFKALTKENISKIFDKFILVFNDVEHNDSILCRLRYEFSNPVSQLRFIQYISSLALASKFKYNLQKTLDQEVNFNLRDLDVELLFGHWNLPVIKAFSVIYLNNEDQLFLNIDSINSAVLDLEITELKTLMEDKKQNINTQYPNEDENEDFPKDDPRNIFSDFSNIFISLYHKKEIPSRIEVREADHKEIGNVSEKLTVLKQE